MVQIVEASEADVPAIHALILALAEYERLADQVVASESDTRRALFGPHPFAEALLARDGDRTVGFALFFHSYSTFLGRPGLYLEDLFVLPEMRSRGIGRQLLAALARLALERGCGRLDWSVLDWNEPAIRFYRRLGARVLDEWRICRLTGDALARVADA